MVKITVVIEINISAYSSISVMNNGEGTAAHRDAFHFI